MVPCVSRPPGRRRLLAAALAACSIPKRPRAEEPASLLVAGPPGSRIDRWADPLAAGLGRFFPAGAPLLRRNSGGLDGVTGANAFEARSEPDGSTALLVPGAAALSWMVGESRVKFDPARWVPLWAAVASSVLVSRVRLTSGSTLKVAAAGPAGPELPALLALDLLGVGVVLAAPGEADAALLQGSEIDPGLASTVGGDMRPVFTLAPSGPDGTPQRDPLLPSVPTAAELVGGRAPPELVAVLRAASLAAQIDAGLVLPSPTPAGAVAAWRRACHQLLADPDLLAPSGTQGTRMMPASTVSAWLGQIAGNPEVLLSLRRWLADRHGWLPA